MNIISTVFTCVFIHTVTPVDVNLLKPNKNGTFDVAVIVTPGADILGQAYQPLGEKLQSAFPGRLWVALLTDFLFDTPNPPEVSQGVDKAKQTLGDHGFKGNFIFLAGHSLGGVFVGNYGLSNGGSLTGVMLWASYLTRNHHLRDYPIPVLTISGDVDGLTRVTRIVDTFEELENETIHNPRPVSLIYSTPVIVMSGINHGHFASGTMPPNVLNHDPPVDDDVTFDSAYEVISEHVTDFIIATIGQPIEEKLTALAGLKSAYFNTKAIIDPLSAMKALDSGGASVSTVLAQQLLLGAQLGNASKINDSHISEADVLFYEPNVKVSGDIAHVQTFTNVQQPFDPMDVSLDPQTPSELQSIMESQEGLHRHLPRVHYIRNNLTCKDLNKFLYNLALSKTSQSAHNRFNHRGSNITINDDVISGSKVMWVSSSLDLEYGSNGRLDVTSYAYVSGDSYDCKLLCPYRAMEWIYIDSLKRTPP
ncbi:uncharacterized protein LOC128232878 [Mya arenaria]|uniref:uncharacterized protein LOC128232878 n=1 Tax=Mya arenaria TaxID=6604 RepID=UPI0022E431B2|nr:uncharacterized protein LOC128232878 [Mya arenaria]